MLPVIAAQAAIRGAPKILDAVAQKAPKALEGASTASKLSDVKQMAANRNSAGDSAGAPAGDASGGAGSAKQSGASGSSSEVSF